MDIEERFHKLEEDVMSLMEMLKELAGGTKLGFMEIEAELNDIKSRLGIKRESSTIPKNKGK
ncbi:MAG: hypothetical protein FWH26_06735 [Oscillospiraceae bacterium]|nr:hypothetical protein [Oscillospiraceae bacterium]